MEKNLSEEIHTVSSVSSVSAVSAVSADIGIVISELEKISQTCTKGEEIKQYLRNCDLDTILSVLLNLSDFTLKNFNLEIIASIMHLSFVQIIAKLEIAPSLDMHDSAVKVIQLLDAGITGESLDGIIDAHSMRQSETFRSYLISQRDMLQIIHDYVQQLIALISIRYGLLRLPESERNNCPLSNNEQNVLSSIKRLSVSIDTLQTDYYRMYDKVFKIYQLVSKDANTPRPNTFPKTKYLSKEESIHDVNTPKVLSNGKKSPFTSMFSAEIYDELSDSEIGPSLFILGKDGNISIISCEDLIILMKNGLSEKEGDYIDQAMIDILLHIRDGGYLGGVFSLVNHTGRGNHVLESDSIVFILKDIGYNLMIVRQGYSVYNREGDIALKAIELDIVGLSFREDGCPKLEFLGEGKNMRGINVVEEKEVSDTPPRPTVSMTPMIDNFVSKFINTFYGVKSGGLIDSGTYGVENPKNTMLLLNLMQNIYVPQNFTMRYYSLSGVHNLMLSYQKNQCINHSIIVGSAMQILFEMMQILSKMMDSSDIRICLNLTEQTEESTVKGKLVKDTIYTMTITVNDLFAEIISSIINYLRAFSLFKVLNNNKVVKIGLSSDAIGEFIESLSGHSYRFQLPKNSLDGFENFIRTLVNIVSGVVKISPESKNYAQDNKQLAHFQIFSDPTLARVSPSDLKSMIDSSEKKLNTVSILTDLLKEILLITKTGEAGEVIMPISDVIEILYPSISSGQKEDAKKGGAKKGGAKKGGAKKENPKEGEGSSKKISKKDKDFVPIDIDYSKYPDYSSTMAEIVSNHTTENGTLLIIAGPPGSGKSHIANQLWNAFNGVGIASVIVSADLAQTRKDMCFPILRFAHSKCAEEVSKFLKMGYIVILDNTNANFGDFTASILNLKQYDTKRGHMGYSIYMIDLFKILHSMSKNPMQIADMLYKITEERAKAVSPEIMPTTSFADMTDEEFISHICNEMVVHTEDPNTFLKVHTQPIPKDVIGNMLNAAKSWPETNPYFSQENCSIAGLYKITINPEFDTPEVKISWRY